ncbi:hypothetical protein GCM10010976_18880 [Bizionia arctica]|uniref:TraB/GumN family protein n=2 Tax=Bizionia arctica TaxID=1495645 RepID=A0A917GJ05_9FLAO|nr:hypothetical protein GCM10010976_18880 [Bizionia arctica]
MTISYIGISQNTILWKVTDTINNKTSFVVGTFHQLGNSFVDSIPEIQESLYQSELAIFESVSKIAETRELINQREKSYEIEKKLNKKDFKNLLEISKDWEVDIYKLKPIEVRWKLQQEFQNIICETVKPIDKWTHFDSYLQELAEQKQIEVLGLETDSVQLNFIYKQYKYPSWKDEKRNLSYLIKQMTTDNPNMNPCNLVNEYKAFDLNYDFEKPCSIDVLIIERNENWLKILPQLMQEKNCFVAVGFYHLKNDCGILQQLKNMGFIVEPVKIQSKVVD